MKLLRTIVLAAAVAGCVMASNAQIFRYGIRAGVNINKLHLSESGLNSKNRTGFTAGIVGEINMPIIPFTVDAALMYAHRSYNVTDSETKATANKSANYFEIPVHLRWNVFSIIGVSRIVKPYLFTGPTFAFTGKKNFDKAFSRSNSDIDWNFGFGAELMHHVQLSAYYSLGLSHTYQGAELGKARNRSWTVTATYIF